METTAKTSKIRTLTGVAVLSAIAFILACFEFPVPLSPAFARMDLSDLPALIGAFAYGPLAGVLIELVKNALQLTSTATAGVGELANFIMGGTFVLVAALSTGGARLKRRRFLPASLQASPWVSRRQS